MGGKWAGKRDRNREGERGIGSRSIEGEGKKEGGGARNREKGGRK